MNETKVFINAFSNYKKFNEKELEVINLKENKINKDTFWFICLNNPRFAVGNRILPIENKCKIIDDSNSYKELEHLKIKDFYIKKYSKIKK